MAFNITAIMNVALASGAATKISRDINKALQNKRVTVDLSLANPDSIKRIKADIEGAITSVESFGRQAGLAAKRFGAFSLAAGSMITLVSAIKSSTAEAISFDREMVRLGQVSNDSVASIQAVGNEVTRLSVALGVSSKDLIGAAVTLKQANLSIDDTKIALEALAKAALAPNFENFANTTQGAIAVLNQFKIGAAGLEAALGSVNAVAGEYAVEASDLVEVIRKTGGAFKSAGGDLNELLALFTSVRQTTRESAETISTGLRTIFTRIQRGQTIESLKELGINLRYTSQEATALGNTKLADQFVGPYEAVRRLSEALAGIPTTSGKYSAIVEELGGYRQISKVIPLLQEFSVSQGALNVALGGSSSLAANAAQAQNAYIIKIQKIKEEFNALIRSVTQSSGFQKIFDTFISGASAAIQLADALKFLLPLITAIAAVKLATSFGQFVKGFATGVTASPNPKIFNQNRVAEGGYIKMAKGGVVPGSGSGDKVKALLEPGELVIPKKYAGGGTVSVNEMSSLAIQRKLNDPLIKEEDYKTGKTINKNDNFKYEIVTIKVDGGKESLKGDYKKQGEFFEKEAEKQLGAIRIAKSDDRGSNSPVDLEKNGFPYEVKNVGSPVSDASIVDKLARYRFQKFGDNIFKNSSKGEETIDLGQIGLVYNTAKITGNDAFKDTETITAGQENYRRKTYATQTSEGISNVTLSTQEAKNRLATKKASGGFMIPGTGNTDSVPMDLDEGSFVVRKSSVAKLGAENLSNISRKGYADGGKVPAMLMPGEFVFSPSSAKSIGSANLERMNKHAKFAAGGRVGLAEGGNPNPIGEEAYTVASQTKIKIPNFQSLEQFVKGFPDLTKAQESLEKIILEEVRAFNANLSEEQKLTEATKIASDVMRKYDDLDRAIEAQKQAMTSRGSARPLADIEADQAELAMLEGRKKRLSEKVGLSSTVLPTGDTEFRTKIGTDQKIETGKGKDYEYKVNEKVNISDEIRNRAREKAVKISPSGNGENIASVTKIRLALEEEGKLRNQAIQAIGEQLRITTGITDKQVLLEMATEKFAIAMQQNAKLAKDGQGRLLGLASLEQDILDSGKVVDDSMRGVSIELKQGSTAFGKLKLIFRNMGDAIEGARREIVDEFRQGGGGIRGTFAALRNSKTLKVAAGVATAAVGIGGQYIASTGGTSEDVSKGSVSEGRYVASAGIGEALNQGATAAIALSMIPVAGPFLAVIGGATAALFGFWSATKKAELELMNIKVDKMAKGAGEKLSELKNFSGVEREQKGIAAFTDVRSAVFGIRQTATKEGLSGAKLEDEVKAKSLEKFGSNLGVISEEFSNSIANMVKPGDKRKSVDIYNEFKGTDYGRLAIESLGIASGKSATEVQKHALALASSAVTAKKLEEAQKSTIAIHEKITLRMSVLTNSVNLASESFKNISESMGNFSEKLEGRSEFKAEQNTSRLKIGTDEKLFDKEVDRAFLPFGDKGNPLKSQAKELNNFMLNLPTAFDAAKENKQVGTNIETVTEGILKKRLGIGEGKAFSTEQAELFKLFSDQLKKEETTGKTDLSGVTGDKITKDALGQAISQMEQLLQSNMQAVSQVSQSYISGLRRISDEQKKYIQELDKVADKTLSVNKAQANIDAAKVRGNPEDFLTQKQRIAPFVQKQINVTQGAVNRGAIKAEDIQSPQAIFEAILLAKDQLEISDRSLQEKNTDLASAKGGDANAARAEALKNSNLRDTIASLGDALKNLRDETVTLAEAESRLTKAEKDRENKLSVAENLLTMDKAGKRNLQRGKDAAEQVAGGANLEDMSLKQRKAFFEYTKLYANVKIPELGGKTGDQVKQAGLERAAGGLGLGVGADNQAADKAKEDILKIEKEKALAAQKYADLLKGNAKDNVDALAKAGDKFITDLQSMLARESDRGVRAQIAKEEVKKDVLEGIEKDPSFKQYKDLIGQGPNKANRENQFSTVFGEENLKNVKKERENIDNLNKLKSLTNNKDGLSDKEALQQAIDKGNVFGRAVTLTKPDKANPDYRKNIRDQIKKAEDKITSLSGPFSREEVQIFSPATDTGIPAGKNATQTADLLKVAESMRVASTSIDKLPEEIAKLTASIQGLQARLNPPAPVKNNANGGFIGRSMGGSIYNNPTKDIAQRDKYPTLLSKGEFVMNEGAARNNRPELEAMNKGHKVNYFAEGTPETAEQMRTRLFKNKYGFDPSLTKEEREKVSRDGAPRREENDKWAKDIQEKYNLTDITIPPDFQFEGYEKHLNKIRPDRKIKKEGRSEVRDINDVKYTIADIRFEFERAVSDLAYVNAEGRKLSKDEDLADNTIERITFGNDTVKEQLEKIKEEKDVPLSLKEITANAKNFDYEGEFFHHLKDFTPRYPFSYGDAIDPSISNDIKAGLVYGLRDTWKKVGGSYGTNLNPIMGKYEAIHEANVINSRNEKGLPPEPPKEWEVFFNKEGQQVYPEFFPSKTPLIPSTFKLPEMNLDTGEFDGKEKTNQEESDILIDLIKKVREQKKQVLAQNIENIKNKVNAQIQAESSLTKGIPLKGMDAKLAKTNENLYARIANPRLPDDKLPFPKKGGEFTPEAEAAPIARPTIAMQEAKAIENVEIQKQTALNRKNRIDDAGRLKDDLFSEAIRHTNPKDLEGKELDYENVKAFGGKENDIKKMMAFKKNQIQSGDTDPIAQRLHTQIAKTIAYQKDPKSDINDPKVYSPFLKTVNISKLSDVKKLSSDSLKSYADENMPVLNPAIMALQEYYDSVDQRRFGFDQTEDFARTIQNKNIELAAKMDREAAMLIARKVRGEVKKEFPEIYTQPSKDMDRLMKLYKTYNQAVGIKWQGADDNLIHAGDPPNKRMIDESMGKHDYQSKNKDYHNIYDQIDIIANDMNYIGENLSVKNGFSIPVYEKVKRDQAVLESFIKDKIQKAPQGSRNIAVQDFLERQKKEKAAKTEEEVKNIAVNNTEKIKNQSGQVINAPKNRAEAAKVIAEEQAKPVVAAPVEQAKPPVIPMPAEKANPPVVAVGQAKPSMSGDRQNAPEDQIAKQDNAQRRMLTSYVSLVQDNPLYWEGTKDVESASKKYHDIFSRFREGTPLSFKYYIARQSNQKGKKLEMDDMIEPINQSSKNIKALSRLGQGGVFSATGDLTNEFVKSNIESRKEKIKKEEEIVLSIGGEKDQMFFEQFARNTLLAAKNLTKVPVVPLFSTGGPVAYRSFGGGVGGVDAMLTPNEVVIPPEIAAKNTPLLQHINSGGDVKNFGFGGRVSRGRPFRVPAYAPNPNPKRFKKVGTDTVAAPGLPAGSFVVNARDSVKNMSVLQNLSSGGTVGYYQKGGGLDKRDFDLLGDPTEKDTKYTGGIDKLTKKVFGSAPSVYENPLKEKFNLANMKDVENKLEKMARAVHREDQGVIKDKNGMPVFSDERMLYNEITNGISSKDFTKFLNSGRMEKSQAEYERLSKIKEDKELQNLPALNAELNSPFKPSKPISEQESLDKETRRLNRESNRTEIANLRIKLSQLKQDPFNPKVNAEYDRVSALIEKKEKEYRDMIGYPLKKEDFNLLPQALGFANGGVVQYYQNAGMVKRAKTEAEKYKDRIDSESKIRQAQIDKIEERRTNVGGEGKIGGIRENEKRILEGAGKAKNQKGQELENQPLTSLSMQELKNKIDKYTNSELDYLDADELQRARQEFANRIQKIRYNEGYTQLNNALNSQKRGGKKDNTEAAERFEDFLRNNNIKGQTYDGLPNALKGKDIDKSYLTGIAHFEPNILNKLNDEKIKNIAINLIKQRKIKGFSGDSGKFEEANYFGELGDKFNIKDVFLKMSDIRPVIDLLNRVDKGRETNLNSTAQGQRIKSKNPLNAKKFMAEYGTKDEDGNPMHTALTARAEYFNQNIKEEGYLNLKPKENENPIEDMMNRPRRFDQGGYVNGASYGDSIDATLRAGEFVLNPEAAKDVGYGNLEKINKQRFFDGGAVGSPRASVFDKMNNVANSQSANSIDVDSLNNAAREFNKAAKSFETSMAKMEKSAKTLEGAMDKLSKVNIPDTITGTIKVDNKIDLDITSSNFAMDMTTAVGKAVSDITGRLKDATDGKIDIA